MSDRNLRWLTVGLLAGGGAGLLALTSTLTAAPALADTATGADPAVLADPIPPYDPSVGLIMGGSGTPIPGTGYVAAAQGLYLDNPLHPNFPGVETPGVLANGLFTPEGLYPLTGVKTLPLNIPVGADGYAAPQTSVGQGITILNDNIQANLPQATTVFGYSQSATIASYEMQLLESSGQGNAPVQFLLIGDPSNPDGGLLSRFPDLSLPSLGIALGNSTPADDFTTVIHTQEYDGYADFPRYPINLLSDLNAVLGIEDVHGTYLDGGVNGVGPTALQIADAIPLATSGATETTYYMIPTAHLPLLDPVRDIPVIGNPIADLLQPDLSLIVNLGYNNPNPLEGWDAGPANVTTPFGLFPPLSQVLAALQELLPQTELGVENFIGDFTGTGPNPVDLASLGSLVNFSSGTSTLPDPLTALSTLASDPASSITDIANTISSAGSTAYATLLPTADIANALLTSIPAYDVSLFLDNLQAGDLLDAVGLPIAADTALFTLAGGFEYSVVSDAVSTILGFFP